jgi:hypothetical protein
VIEGDDRLMAEYPPGLTRAPTLRVNTVAVRRTRDYQFISAKGTTNVLQAGGAYAQERNDCDAAWDQAGQLAELMQDKCIEAKPVIPWIETGYALGDRISEIRGRQLRFSTRVGGEQAYPGILGRRYIWREQRYETELELGITRPLN